MHARCIRSNAIHRTTSFAVLFPIPTQQCDTLMHSCMGTTARCRLQSAPMHVQEYSICMYRCCKFPVATCLTSHACATSIHLPLDVHVVRFFLCSCTFSGLSLSAVLPLFPKSMCLYQFDEFVLVWSIHLLNGVLVVLNPIARATILDSLQRGHPQQVDTELQRRPGIQPTQSVIGSNHRHCAWDLLHCHALVPSKREPSAPRMGRIWMPGTSIPTDITTTNTKWTCSSTYPGRLDAARTQPQTTKRHKTLYQRSPSIGNTILPQTLHRRHTSAIIRTCSRPATRQTPSSGQKSEIRGQNGLLFYKICSVRVQSTHPVFFIY